MPPSSGPTLEGMLLSRLWIAFFADDSSAFLLYLLLRIFIFLMCSFCSRFFAILSNFFANFLISTSDSDLSLSDVDVADVLDDPDLRLYLSLDLLLCRAFSSEPLLSLRRGLPLRSGAFHGDCPDVCLNGGETTP